MSRERVRDTLEVLHDNADVIADAPQIGAVLLLMAGMTGDQLVDLGDRWLLEGWGDVAEVAWSWGIHSNG